MKKTIAQLVLTGVMAVSMFALMPTQQAEAKNWTWKMYRLKFWLPNGMKVYKNNRYGFISRGRGVTVKIKPWKSRRTTSKRAAMYGYRTYTFMRRKRILLRKRIRSRNGMWRYLIVGTGRYRRQTVYFAVIGMAGKRSANNFYVRMWWKKWRHKWVLPRVGKIAKRLRAY
ncbi:MAG: hypothetical protein CL920_18220 [Deltaproteobacteria bacterium]|nr:hypothetical protein [Deltaproteobacteria bacterium]|tara:strand:+ start:2974 stop:3483 length:510 start_codon:yes stop_codon:yes gene_type:complete